MRLCKQLQQIWTNLPDGRRIVFAWSEGTLYVRALPLSQMSGVILLGGIATNIGDVIAAEGGPDSSHMKQMLMRGDSIGYAWNGPSCGAAP